MNNIGDLYKNPTEIDLSKGKSLDIDAINEAANEVIKHYGEPKPKFVGEPDPEIVAELLYKYIESNEDTKLLQ